MSNVAKEQTTGTDTKDCQQSTGSANNNQSVPSDMDIEMGTSLSSGQDSNILSNGDALHSEDNACRKDARITRELSEDVLSHNCDGIIMSDNEFILQLDGDKCFFFGQRASSKVLNEIEQLRVQLYKTNALLIKHIV